MLSAAIDRANPLQAEYSYGASLSSLEAYRATYQRDRTNMSGAEPVHLDTLPDSRAINAAKEELFNGIESRIERRRAEQRWRIGRQSIEHVRENRQTLH